MKRIFGFIGVLLLLMAIPIYARTVMISYSDEFKPTSQYGTGVYEFDNCGAASTYMVLDYYGMKPKSVAEVRQEIRPYSGWIWTTEIEAYLDKNNVDYQLCYMNSVDSLVESLNKGIVMLCVDASRISNKEYIGSGHFIVVVGYREDLNGRYFEVYDPASSKIEYYDAEEVYLSVKDWWGYFFLFEKKIE